MNQPTILNPPRTLSTTALTVLLLRVACLAVFLGRAWQHWFWDAPWRAFFWDETLLQEVVGWSTGLSWQAYTTHPNTDQYISWLIQGFGIFYVLCAVATVLAQRPRRWTGYWLLAGSGALLLLAVLYWKEQFFRGGQLIEYASQIGSPLLLYGALFGGWRREELLVGLKVAVSLTFLGHGLYALGFYPVPGHFVEMTIRITGMGEADARLLLQVAGLLDMVVAVGIFWPKVARGCLLYAGVWGLATALARPWAGFHPALPWVTLHQSLFEAVYRLPHAVLPLAAWVMINKFPAVVRSR